MKLSEVLQPLLENKVDHIAKNQGHKIIQRAKEDRSVTDPNPDTHELVQFMADNISKKYLQWVVNRYLQGDFLLNEDYQVLQEALTKYQQFQQAIGPLKKNTSVADLYQSLEPYKELDIDDEKERNLITSGQAEIVFQQGNERVIIPHTYVASEYFAKDKWGTEWCTRFDGQYKIYSEQGPLYMIDINDGEEVYQAHWESKEGIKDRWDEVPEDMESLRNRSGAITWVIERGKERIENMKTGDPSGAAYWMVDDGYAEPEWAKKVIENTKTGDPSGVAYLMVRDGYTKDTEWAMRIIENNKTGDPSRVAYWVVKDGFTKDTEWAMKVIENDKTGIPSRAAYWMVDDGYTKDTEWAKKVIENTKTGDPSGVAYLMVRDGYTKDTEWAMKVIENAKTGDPSWNAHLMVKDGHAPQEWYDRNFG